MLKYPPLQRKYPGDAQMRPSAQQNKATHQQSTSTTGKRKRGGGAQEYPWMLEYKKSFKDAKTHRGVKLTPLWWSNHVGPPPEVI